MNLFGVFVIFCGILVCNGQPVDDQLNAHKQPMRYRLQHYPGAPQNYQTQVIDYPGGVYSGQNVAYAPNPAAVNTQINYQRYQQAQPVANSQHQAAPSQNPIPSTSTAQPATTQLPVVKSQQPITEAPAAVRAPIRRIVQQHPQQQPSAAHRFQIANGQEFVDEVDLPGAVVDPKPETDAERMLREEQAKNAHYSFGTAIDDGINDHSIHRQETRNGLALRGMYSYSDGFYHRTIHYQADENGYRVTKEEIEPIGDGPQFDPNGTAEVATHLHNKNLHYSITADDFVRERKNKTAIAVGHEQLKQQG